MTDMPSDPRYLVDASNHGGVPSRPHHREGVPVTDSDADTEALARAIVTLREGHYRFCRQSDGPHEWGNRCPLFIEWDRIRRGGNA